MNEVLYILMRTDLASLNPGKAMAQANHAYGALKHAIREKVTNQKMYLAWMDQTPQEFGTTIVLGGSWKEIDEAVRFAETVPLRTLVVGRVVDPSYPMADGEVVHLIRLPTCAFIFGTKEDCDVVVKDFELHP